MPKSKNNPLRRPRLQQFSRFLCIRESRGSERPHTLIYDIQISGKVMRCTASQVRLVIVRWRLSRLSAQQESPELCLDALSKKAVAMRGPDSFDNQDSVQVRSAVCCSLHQADEIPARAACGGCERATGNLVFSLLHLL